jgi:predicted small secreted protein
LRSNLAIGAAKSDYPFRFSTPAGRVRYVASEMLLQLSGCYESSRFNIHQKKEMIFMDRLFLRKVFLALILACSLAGILSSFACNTVHGLGQDIERGGEKTEDAADAVKRRL